MAGRRKRKTPRNPPTSHSEASLLNQRNPEGSVSNLPQFNDPDASPLPQRARASLPPSETTPLPQNRRRGHQDANLTSPPHFTLNDVAHMLQNKLQELTLPQTAQSSSSSMQRLQVTVNQDVMDLLSILQLEGEGISRSTQGIRTPFLTPQPLQTPSSPQAAGSIFTGRHSKSLPSSLNPSPSSGVPKICRVCGSSLYVRLCRTYGLSICRACYFFYHGLTKNKNKTALLCKGNNDCTNFRGQTSCQSCRYKKCLDARMPPINGYPTPPSPPSTRPQASASVHGPQPTALTPFPISQETTLHQLGEQVQISEGGNQSPREAQTAAVPQPSRLIAPSEPSAVPSRSGSPQFDFDPILRKIVRWGNGILSGKQIPEPQKNQILRTQWRMLLTLTCFEEEEYASEVNEFYAKLKPKFQKWQVTPGEFEHLKKIAIFMRPEEPCENPFQSQLDEQYKAFYILCSDNPPKHGNLLQLLSTIQYSTPNIPISEKDVVTIIKTILRK